MLQARWCLEPSSKTLSPLAWWLEEGRSAVAGLGVLGTAPFSCSCDLYGMKLLVCFC
uniref:Uncharacterized protein n=1 Tax=Arundo donax TaxID=35708 RepID=A0A0A8Z3U5_ARUDO